MSSFLEYLNYNRAELLQRMLEHLWVVAISISLGTVLGLALGVWAYRKPRVRTAILGTTGLILTIPSLALYALLVGVIGLGTPPVVVALTLYSLLPIVRNTLAGLLGVDPAIVESAQGMGMSRWRRLLRIEVPLAWPVIIAGIRVSTVIVVGIAALGAIVNGPGLGVLIFDGLRRIGSPVALNIALAGTLGVVILGVALDALFIAITRFTTPRGIRD
jgi:osmoprotectant transport system permease protein